MSFNSVSLNNPDIDQGVQLARRQAEGIEDIYFRETSGDITVSEDHPGQVDLTDEVTRRVDPNTLPLDPIAEHEQYRMVGDKNYIVRSEDVGGGKRVTYLQEVKGRGYYDDVKKVLIGGKLYEIEFEKDPETKKVSTYLTSSVGDLFSNDKFLQGQTPAQKLELLGKIQKSATFITWYDSGEYDRCQRREAGEKNPELDPNKVRHYDYDAGAKKLEDDLKKQAGYPKKLDPMPVAPEQTLPMAATSDFLGFGMGFFINELLAAQAQSVGNKAVQPFAKAPQRYASVNHKPHKQVVQHSSRNRSHF